MSKATISQASTITIPLPQSRLATCHLLALLALTQEGSGGEEPLATAFLIETRPRIEIGVTHSFKRRKHFLIETRMRYLLFTELTIPIADPAKINRLKCRNFALPFLGFSSHSPLATRHLPLATALPRLATQCRRTLCAKPSRRYNQSFVEIQSLQL